MFKNKKILAFMGSTIAAAIPVAVVVSCGSASNEWKYKNDEHLYEGGPTLGDFQKDVEKTDSSNGKSWDIIKKQAAFFYYEQEHKGSLNVQRDQFLWEKKKKNDELDSLVDNDNNKKAIEDLKKDISEIDKKIEEIKTPNSLNYSSSDFSSDFPEVLLPITEIKKKQEEIFNNEKNAFVSKYSTKQEGEAAWVAQLSTKYDGANTKDEAINNLVFNVIKTNAFLRNNIKIDSSYTVKQLRWANTTDADGAFPFLNIDGYDGTGNVEDAITSKSPSLRVSGNDDDDKVYFYGSDSKIWGHQGEENLKIFDESRLQDLIGDKSYRMYRHVLLNIQPNSKGRTLPWEASIDEIKKLLALQPTQDDVATDPKYQFQRIQDLWDGMDNFNSDVDEETGFFLKQVSDNSPSTKNIGGSLGVHKASYFSNAMFDGFSLGALDLEKNSDDDPTNQDFASPSKNDSIYIKLTNAIEKAQKEILDLASTPFKYETNKALYDYIDAHADDVKNIFGRKIRDLFDPNVMKEVGFGNIEKGQIGRSLLYTDIGTKDKDNRFAFISTKNEGGIHLVKRYIVDGTSLGAEAIKDLEKIASEEDTKVSQYNIVELIKPFLDEDKLVKKLVNSDLSTGEGKAFSDLITSKIKDEEIELSDLQDPAITDAKTLIGDAQEYINNQGVVKANEIASQITSAHSDYLKKALDNKEIAYEAYTAATSAAAPAASFTSNEVFLPENIYKIAYELAQKENGA